MDLVILNKYTPSRIGNVVWLYLLSLGFKHALEDPQIYVQVDQPLKITQPLFDALELQTIDLRNECPKVENGNVYLVFPGGVTKLTFANGQLAEKEELPFFKISTKKAEDVYEIANAAERPIYDRHTVLSCAAMHPYIRDQHYHLIDQMAAVISLLCPGYAIDRILLPKPLQAEIKQRKCKFDLPQEYITINLGCSKPVKEYPYFMPLLRGLLGRGENLVIIGGEQNALAGLQHTKLHNLTGQLSLLDTTAVIARSKLHIAGDTGTGHIAALLDVPVCSLFGQITYPEVCRPYGNKVCVVQSAQSWSPTMQPTAVLEVLADLAKQTTQPCIITL